MFERKSGPPQELMDLARSYTSGDVSARRHQASRARVLDRWTAPSRKGRMIAGVVIGSFALSTAAFAAIKVNHHEPPSVGRPVATSGIKTTAAPFPSALPDPSAAPDTETPAAPEPPAEGPVMIHVEPETATVMWDEQELVGENHVANSLPDQHLHRLRVSATGYETKTINIVTREPRTELTVKLNPLPMKIGDIMSDGAFSNTDEVIEGLRDRFRDCYSEGLAQDPTVTGTADLHLDVTPNGKVRTSEVLKAHGLSTIVTTCVAHVGSSAEFEPSGGKTAVMVNVPLFFGVTE